MIRVEEIKQHLASLLDGSCSIDDFEDWIVAKSWNMQTSSDNASQKLVGAIEVRLAEFHQSHLTHNELLAELQEVSDSFGTNTYFERFAFDGEAFIR